MDIQHTLDLAATDDGTVLFQPAEAKHSFPKTCSVMWLYHEYIQFTVISDSGNSDAEQKTETELFNCR